MCFSKRQNRAIRGRIAFSIVELMLAISIMGVIVFALYSVFNQTQRALRASETQGAISDRARAVMEIITRELEQMHPAYLHFQTNHVTNFLVQLDFLPREQGGATTNVSARRTNVFESFFFTTTETNHWNVVGYRINHFSNAVGELVRYSAYTNFPYSGPALIAASSNFLVAPVTHTNFHHIADGVVHFRLTPYDLNGWAMRYDTTNKVPGVYRIFRTMANGQAMQPFQAYSDVTNRYFANVFLEEAISGFTNYTRASFTTNAVPAYVELELAMLEPEVLRQYRQMLEDANPNANIFLSDKISKVHIFRQRIPIRTAAQ